MLSVSQLIALLDVQIQIVRDHHNPTVTIDYEYGFIRGLEQAKYILQGAEDTPESCILHMTRQEAEEWTATKALGDDKVAYLYKVNDGEWVMSNEHKTTWVFKAYPGGRTERRANI